MYKTQNLHEQGVAVDLQVRTSGHVLIYNLDSGTSFRGREEFMSINFQRRMRRL